MNIPGVPIGVPVPVALMDREPEGAELELFTAVPANDWNRDAVFVNVPAARRIARSLVEQFHRLPGLLTPLG